MLYQKFIITSLEAAANIALEKIGNVSSTTKSGDNNQVLTEADLAIGQLLVQKVKQTYPDHNIIDEEAGVIDNGSTFTWVIDPIDGTSNFANQVPLYGIMMGLLVDDQPVAGGFVLPSSNELYVAERGHGAWCSGKKIHVTEETKLLSTPVAYGIDGHQEDPTRTIEETGLMAHIVLGIRNLRSTGSVFDAGMVARGSFGAVMYRTCKIWDVVAQHIVIEEAGGVCTDFWGKPVDYSNALTRSDENFTWCAGAPAIHQQLQKIVNR